MAHISPYRYLGRLVTFYEGDLIAASLQEIVEACLF